MLDWIRGGTTYPLDDGTYCWLVGDNGWGAAPLRRLSERGPQQHGDTDRGFRLDPRTGTIVVFLRGNSRSDLYSKRATLLDLFAPDEAGGSLRWTLTGRTRQIDCHYVGDMSMDSSDRDGFNQKVAVTLKASDPTFYDPTAVAVTFNLGGGTDALEIPMEVPMVVGASELDVTENITYTGNFRTYPHLIRITGPITDPMIQNEVTGHTLDFDGVTISAGDFYDIDLRYGEKTVVDSSGTNKVGDLTDDSDLGSWHLASIREVTDGINSVRVTGSSVTTATQVQLTYYTRYTGI